MKLRTNIRTIFDFLIEQSLIKNIKTDITNEDFFKTYVFRDFKKSLSPIHEKTIKSWFSQYDELQVKGKSFKIRDNSVEKINNFFSQFFKNFNYQEILNDFNKEFIYEYCSKRVYKQSSYNKNISNIWGMDSTQDKYLERDSNILSGSYFVFYYSEYSKTDQISVDYLEIEALSEDKSLDSELTFKWYYGRSIKKRLEKYRFRGNVEIIDDSIYLIGGCNGKSYSNSKESIKKSRIISATFLRENMGELNNNRIGFATTCSQFYAEPIVYIVILCKTHKIDYAGVDMPISITNKDLSKTFFLDISEKKYNVINQYLSFDKLVSQNIKAHQIRHPILDSKSFNMDMLIQDKSDS